MTDGTTGHRLPELLTSAAAALYPPQALFIYFKSIYLILKERGGGGCVCSGSELLFYGVWCQDHISIYQSQCPQSPRNQSIMNRVPLSSSSRLPACEPAA